MQEDQLTATVRNGEGIVSRPQGRVEAIPQLLLPALEMSPCKEAMRRRLAMTLLEVTVGNLYPRQ